MVEQWKRGRGWSEEGDGMVERLRADIACLISHLQVFAYYKERQSQSRM